MPHEYFYIGFWILVSGNTKGNWEFCFYLYAASPGRGAVSPVEAREGNTELARPYAPYR